MQQMKFNNPFRIGLKILSLAMLFFVSEGAFAKGERFGLSAGQFSIDEIDYDEGTLLSDKLMRYKLIHTRPMDENNNRWRWWFALDLYQDTLFPQGTGIYQESFYIGAEVIPQFALGKLWNLTPFVGAGGYFGYASHSNRWEVDEDGFKYGVQLDDIGQLEYGLAFNFGTIIKIGSNPNSHLQITPMIAYKLPLMDDVYQGVELSVALLF